MHTSLVFRSVRVSCLPVLLSAWLGSGALVLWVFGDLASVGLVSGVSAEEPAASSPSTSSTPSALLAPSTPPAPSTSSVQDPVPTVVTQPRELFNGRDLTNWYTFLAGRGVNSDPKGVFTVQDGKICISGEECGCITTNEAFENYRLVIEYRWTGKPCGPRRERAMDCGVLVHSVGADGAWHGTWIPSIECNVIEGGTGDFIVVGDGTENYQITALVKDELQGKCGVYDPKGKPMTITSGRINWWGRSPEWEDRLGMRGAQDLEKPVGEWNTLEILCDGDRITNVVNGTVAAAAFNVKPSHGKIQIQSEYAGMEIRRVSILPLEKPVAPLEKPGTTGEPSGTPVEPSGVPEELSSTPVKPSGAAVE